jgi:hypothetical protein
MQARYHLHLVVPTVFFAVIGLAAIWSWKSKVAIGAGVILALSPWLHGEFISNIMFNEQQEHVFVQQQSEFIETGCNILEYEGNRPGSKRFRRHGLMVTEFGMVQRFKLTGFHRSKEAQPLLPEQIRTILLKPSKCTYYYEGLQCWNGKKLEESIAPACAEVRALMKAEVVASHSFPNREYDENQSIGINPDQATIELKLYRLNDQASPIQK